MVDDGDKGVGMKKAIYLASDIVQGRCVVCYVSNNEIFNRTLIL